MSVVPSGAGRRVETETDVPQRTFSVAEGSAREVPGSLPQGPDGGSRTPGRREGGTMSGWFRSSPPLPKDVGEGRRWARDGPRVRPDPNRRKSVGPTGCRTNRSPRTLTTRGYPHTEKRTPVGGSWYPTVSSGSSLSLKVSYLQCDRRV